MPTHIEWSSIALRLALTAIASAAIGSIAGDHNRPVGLRTTMFVAVAAAISRIRANLLLPIAGKSAGSFVTLDLMRLRLGSYRGWGSLAPSQLCGATTLCREAPQRRCCGSSP
jgi:putative Mg2+ transporter-C (MgtC) family protein